MRKKVLMAAATIATLVASVVATNVAIVGGDFINQKNQNR